MPDVLTPSRQIIREGQWKRHGVRLVADHAGVSHGEAVALLREMAIRLAGAVRVRQPIRVDRGAFRVEQCAGLLRIAPSLEMEIVPKFLSASDPTWREDFFLIATVAGARLLLRERLHTSATEARDLPSLVGAALVGAFRTNERRPLRTYRRHHLMEFAVDGDMEPESLLLPDADGFAQDVTTFDQENEFNAVLRAAAQALLPEVSHPEVRVHLMRVFERLSPQARLRGRPRDRAVPSRHRAWQPSYDLAVQVLRGFGATYDAGGLPGPGFVVHTWRAWQDLVAEAASIGLPEYEVRAQWPFRFGTRHTAAAAWTTTSRRAASVKPDVVVRDIGTGTTALVVDAKYKLARGPAGDPKQPRIGQPDLYETLAFLAAAKTQRAVLLYPRQDEGVARDEPGTVTPFERITVGGADVWGAEVEVRGIAHRGFPEFARTLGDGLREALTARA